MKEEIENYENEKKNPNNTIKEKSRRNTCKKAKQYRIMKISVVKMKQQLKTRNTNRINHRESKQNIK